ncbi:hypothetical protein BpHYR1_039553 [Brachionus plicatilis]|uniref:Uncharacterized protein n=1 Tax=Brachionus plicatilis TaxID=10195 RepID=A0A3M7QV28_BRAPC|nr:hypothetical protein BpHYR1_039553 [Brachionus plicatilis]
MIPTCQDICTSKPYYFIQNKGVLQNVTICNKYVTRQDKGCKKFCIFIADLGLMFNKLKPNNVSLTLNLIESIK